MRSTLPVGYGHKLTIAPGANPFASHPTTLEFARLAQAGYGEDAGVAGGFARHGVSVAGGAGALQQRWRSSGFKASMFRRKQGVSTCHILALAGTEDVQDGMADLGFGGSLTSRVARLNPSVDAGSSMFQSQVNSALEILGAARSVMAPRDHLYVTGHSLGGGLAQIVAARTGVAAVTFHPVPVRALDDVLAAYGRTKPTIVNFRFDNDPVNAVGVVSAVNGRSPYVGRAYTVPTPRSGLDAHRIPLTVAELSPQGQFSVLGATDPFNDGAVRNAFNFRG